MKERKSAYLLELVEHRVRRKVLYCKHYLGHSSSVRCRQFNVVNVVVQFVCL